MEKIRKPFQGVLNIIKFNWHFYVIAIVFLILLYFLKNHFNSTFNFYSNILFWLIISSTLISLFVSYYVYDLSGLYNLNWLNKFKDIENSTILNINAGFDETSALLQNKYKNSKLIVLDFYDPIKHTEISIKRARKAFPPYPNTQQVSTTSLPLKDESIDKMFIIFAAHEIRNDEERKIFFTELYRILKQNGQIIVTEHLRDLPNFFAYNIGFFHFLSKKSWDRTFQSSKFIIKNKFNFDPFISIFILEKNGVKS